MAKDVVIPLVFPDVHLLGLSITEGIGHSGTLVVDIETGRTRYGEYGRYDPDHNGGAQEIKYLPDVEIVNGQIDMESLRSVLDLISYHSADGTRVEGVMIEAEDAYERLGPWIRETVDTDWYESDTGEYNAAPWVGKTCIAYTYESLLIAGVPGTRDSILARSIDGRFGAGHREFRKN